ncbi:P-loop containing nucleoside triphosphate hydrolase protein [Russula earlei]|uniref:P-loop containing nucleoside triphosphate hydrolase protein n=1 Tax=Russula earlei TaxID=71964 RepID=A0ACC0U1Z6_9AGAM|nr:P-loop containing nucleoside triphosphate hydrolase protein [Russula earlei]
MQQEYAKGNALKEFSIDLTELAKAGKLDPVIGRDEGKRLSCSSSCLVFHGLINLCRDSAYHPNPISENKVESRGKTAILEGLASRIIAKEVPESLHNKRVLSIDLSAILAGSGIRGQFEEKFKALIRDIEDEAGGVICFIDEVHTLFNLGKTEGSIDGGQMIKPALARGLQLVGATTPDEYRKTISKDAALERRFQPVTIEEPTVESTTSILARAQTPLRAAVYAARYISDRFLPDKAIDLVDEAASSLRLAQESKPDALEQLDRAVMTMQIELTSLRNESDPLSTERRSALEQALERARKETATLEERWKAERERLQRNKDRKRRLEEAKHELEVAQRKGDYEVASRLRYATIPELEREIPSEGNGESVMLSERVTSDDIARVVAARDGHSFALPVYDGKAMEDALKARVVGQDLVVRAVSDAVRISRAGLQAPTRPVASFLFLGPTGVGKTELCKALAGFLFNDEQRALININMSEYHDRHTMSRLIGAAPGYVGFEEGGQLTEAVRRKPYGVFPAIMSLRIHPILHPAVVLLDELEKAHKDVTMILLQILDEGTITDSQGRKVDFRNTIICLTSNIGSDILAHPTSSDSSGIITPEARAEVLERVTEQFPPELLNRLDSMLVFNRLAHESILRVVDLRLNDVAARLAQRRIKLDVDDAARAWLAEKGFSDVYGARAIARVVRTSVLFPLAQKLLMGTIRDGDVVEIRVGADGKMLHIRDNHAADDRIVSPAIQEH